MVYVGQKRIVISKNHQRRKELEQANNSLGYTAVMNFPEEPVGQGFLILIKNYGEEIELWRENDETIGAIKVRQSGRQRILTIGCSLKESAIYDVYETSFGYYLKKKIGSPVSTIHIIERVRKGKTEPTYELYIPQRYLDIFKEECHYLGFWFSENPECLIKIKALNDKEDTENCYFTRKRMRSIFLNKQIAQRFLEYKLEVKISEDELIIYTKEKNMCNAVLNYCPECDQITTFNHTEQETWECENCGYELTNESVGDMQLLTRECE